MHDKTGSIAGYSIIGLGLVIEAMEHVEFIWSHVPNSVAAMIDQKAVFLLLWVGFVVLFLRKREDSSIEVLPPPSQNKAEANSENATTTGVSVTQYFGSLQPVPSPSPTPISDPPPVANTPNLILVRVLTGSLIYVGDQWRRGFVEDGPPAPRMQAVFVEIKNAKSESRDVGAALGIKAELTITRESVAEEFSDLAWVEHHFNTVNFDFNDTHSVLLAVNLVSRLTNQSQWVIPLNHRGFKDHEPGVSKRDLQNYWKEEFDTRLKLDLLQIKTGKIIQSFEGQCAWRDGHSGPKISFKPLS